MVSQELQLALYIWNLRKIAISNLSGIFSVNKRVAYSSYLEHYASTDGRYW